jgi:ABC-2 type transport system ATP-binding protein
VSFEIKKGEFFGIVGRNGSGKSTLLKLLAGIYTPTKGTIQIHGSLTPFIELGVGFNPELTGRENVYLNGALLGFNRKQISAMYADIVEFAELKRFMDQKLKNYSSGMQVRLAFSIAIRAQSDILLLDEVLAVGDAAFQQKCNDYFSSLKRSKQTIVLVSHSMASIEQYCDRALLLESSKVMKLGASSEVAGIYEDMILKEEAEKRSKGLDSQDIGDSDVDAKVAVVQDGKKVKSVKAFEDFQVEVSLKSQKDIPQISVGINIKNSEGLLIYTLDTLDYLGTSSMKKDSETKFVIEFDNVFANGMYYITLGVGDASETSPKQLLKKRNIANFTVYGVRKSGGSLLNPRCKVRLVQPHET